VVVRCGNCGPPSGKRDLDGRGIHVTRKRHEGPMALQKCTGGKPRRRQLPPKSGQVARSAWHLCCRNSQRPMLTRSVVAVLIVLIVLPFSAPGAVCGVSDLFGATNTTPHALGGQSSSSAHVDDGTALLAPPAASMASRLKLHPNSQRIDTPIASLPRREPWPDSASTSPPLLLPQSFGILRI